MAYMRDHFVMCAICGFRKRRSEVRRNWKHQLVCSDTCWEPRHPQDYVRVRPDRVAVRDSQPEPEDRFLSYGEITADDL